MTGNSVTHEGIIEKISGKQCFIRLSRQPACDGCGAKSICSVPDSKGGEIMIADRESGMNAGDRVIVSITPQNAYKALVLGYVLPAVLVILTMVLFSVSGAPEWLTALASLSLLVPYYLMIRLFGARMERTFRFSVNKMTTL